jgi:hypothetical protein
VKRGLIIIGVIVITSIALLATVGTLVLGVTQSISDVGDQFMRALQNHDISAAYGMLAAELRDKVREAAFRDIFIDAKVASWSFSSRSVKDDAGLLSGEAAIDDKTFKVELNLIKRDGKWQLTAYNFNQ